MKIEVEFTGAEEVIFGQLLADHADELRDRWHVEDMAQLVHLLAMHGYDESAGLFNQ